MAMLREDILAAIKEKVISVVPDANVMLFGSRARGDWHEESDWDILVLTKGEVDYKLKQKVQNSVFPVGLSVCAFIHTILINEQQWLHHPGLYSLFSGIQQETIKL